MSSNNQLVIYKKDKKYHIKHIDMETGDLKDKFPYYSHLEDAVKAANKFIEYCEREGFGVEYGLSIKL